MQENAKAVGIQTAVQLSYVEKEGMVTRIDEIVKQVKEVLFDDAVFENMRYGILMHFHVSIFNFSVKQPLLLF